MSDITVIVLTIASGVFTIAGTAAVAVNYFRAADLARIMRDQMEAEARERAALGNLAWIEDYQNESVNLQPTKERFDHVRSTVLESLSPRGYLAAGLVCFVIGAALGIAAGIGGVVR